MAKLSKHFCFKPWIERYIHFDTCGPCCVNHKLFKGNIREYERSSELKQLRKDFLDGKKPTSCSGCWDAEEQGIKSVRQTDNVVKSKTPIISVSLSNKCNFKCRMCNPEDSSAWALDTEACDVLGWHDVPTDTNLSTVNWILNLAKKQRLHLRVMGGEPLISDEFLHLMKEVDKHDLYKNIYLILTTNLSVLSYKGINYLQYFEKFPKLDIYASFDGVGKVGEYIRHGFNFNKFDQNIQKAGKLITHLCVTIQLYNLFDMPNIFSYADKHNLEVNFNYLVTPSFLRIENLNSEDKKLVLKHYKDSNFSNEELESMLSNTTTLNEKDKFFKYTKDLDIIWSKDFLQSIPQLENLV